MPAEILRHTRRAGVALLLTVAVFWRAALTNDIFIGRDIVRVYYPLRHYFAQRVLGGSFPTWYPYDGLGQPFVGMMMGSLFHPVSLLYLVLPLFLALKWNILLSYTAGWLGLYVLLRGVKVTPAPSALAATLFAFTGYAVCISNNLLYLMAAMTLPWVFHCALQALVRPSPGKLLLASATLASLLFAGDPQTFALAAGGVLLLACAGEGAWVRRAVSAAAVVTLAVGLSAVQVLPSLATRGEAWVLVNPSETALRWSGHPLRILEMLLGPLWLLPTRDALLSLPLGHFFEPVIQSEWVDSQHVGLLAVALAGVGAWGHLRQPVGRALLGGFVFLGLLWLGKHAGLYGLLHDFLPLWGSFRYPEKLTPFLVLLVCIGAAFGLQWATAALASSRRFGRALGILSVAVTTLALLEWRFGMFSRQLLLRAGAVLPIEDIAQLGQNFIRCSLETSLALGAASLMLLFVRSQRARLWSVAGLCAAAAVGPNLKLYAVGAPELLTEKPELLSRMEADGPSPKPSRLRISVLRTDGPISPEAVARLRNAFEAGLAKPEFDAQSGVSSVLPDVGALWDVEAADGYLPAASLRTMGSTLQGTTGLFDTAYLVTHQDSFREMGSPASSAVARSALGLVARRNPGKLPRAYLAEPRCVADEAAALAFLSGTNFRPGMDVAVECDPAQPLPASRSAGPSGEARVDTYLPEAVTVSVKALRPAVLVLNDAFYSGWTATLDGEKTSLLPANGLVRGVPVPVGTHKVVFRYRCPGLQAGTAVSLGTVLLLLLWMLLARSNHSTAKSSHMPAKDAT